MILAFRYLPGTGSANSEIFMVKLDANGDSLQTRTFGTGGENFDSPDDFIQTESGDFYITGYTKIQDVDTTNILLAKVDNDGNKVWTELYDVNMEKDYGHGIVFANSSEDELLIAGKCNGATNMGHSYLMKSDSSGNLVWEKEITDFAESYAVQILRIDKSLYMGGTIENGSVSSKMFLMKLMDNGRGSVSVRNFDQINDQLDVTIFPNPAKGSFMINIVSVQRQRISINMADISGRLIKEIYNGFLEKGDNSFAIDSKILNPGVYFCKIRGSEDQRDEIVKPVIIME
jgi:hypothetical protein